MIRDCALGDWLPEEAQAWWSARDAASGTSTAGAKPKPKPSEVSALGKTIAVALEGRDLT